MIIESPESIVKTTRTHPYAIQAAGTSDLPGTPNSIDNKAGRGNLKVMIDHAATASAHTLVVSVLHCDTEDGTYAIATDDAGDPLTFSVAGSASAAFAMIRARMSRLKRFVRIRSVVVGGSGVGRSIVVEQYGLDSDQCDGAAAYAILT